MKIAILGGRFDPPHWGHFWVAQQVLERVSDISSVWLMPVHTHHWKPTVADPRSRLEMAKLLETDKIKTSAVEVNRAGTSYTVDTIKVLKADYNEDQFFWIVGSDALSDFAKWRESAKLSMMISFLVFPRAGYPLKIMSSGMRVVKGDLIQTSLSSTLIRDRLKKNLSISGLVPPLVEQYINEKNLYR